MLLFNCNISNCMIFSSALLKHEYAIYSNFVFLFIHEIFFHYPCLRILFRRMHINYQSHMFHPQITYSFKSIEGTLYLNQIPLDILVCPLFAFNYPCFLWSTLQLFSFNKLTFLNPFLPFISFTLSIQSMHISPA